MSGTLYDTYVAALRHDTAEVPEGAVRLGVVRRPTPWFYSAVDENVPALGPPEDLLVEAKDRQATLEAEGVADAEAHNAAMDDVDFDGRYLEYLDESEDARGAVDDLRERLAAGEDVALVCYENTDEKRCHRTLLRERVESGDG